MCMLIYIVCLMSPATFLVLVWDLLPFGLEAVETNGCIKLMGVNPDIMLPFLSQDCLPMAFIQSWVGEQNVDFLLGPFHVGHL